MDLTFLQYLQKIHTPFLDKIMVFINFVTNFGLNWIIVAGYFIYANKPSLGLYMIATLFVMHVICNVILKPLVKRPRVCDVYPKIKLLVKKPKDYSFPSGHTYSSFAVTTIVFQYSKLMGVIFLIISIAIAFSRMYLFLHYPTDIIAGIGLGIATGIATYHGINYLVRIGVMDSLWQGIKNYKNLIKM